MAMLLVLAAVTGNRMMLMIMIMIMMVMLMRPMFRTLACRVAFGTAGRSVSMFSVHCPYL